MKTPTHWFGSNKFEVIVHEEDEHTAKIEYVGPNVPSNRKIGDIRRASKKDAFTGEPTLTAIAIEPAAKPPVKTIETAAKVLSNLAYRWRDESQYEDFADYVKSMTAALPDGATKVAMKKKPFAVQWTDATGVRNELRVGRSRVSHYTYETVN